MLCFLAACQQAKVCASDLDPESNTLLCCRQQAAVSSPLTADMQHAQTATAQAQPLSVAQLAPCAITQLDFVSAVKKVQPSVRREGFATTPDVTWSDVGSLTEVLLPFYSC